jgi:hypothetical protein
VDATRPTAQASRISRVAEQVTSPARSAPTPEERTPLAGRLRRARRLVALATIGLGDVAEDLFDVVATASIGRTVALGALHAGTHTP